MCSQLVLAEGSVVTEGRVLVAAVMAQVVHRRWGYRRSAHSNSMRASSRYTLRRGGMPSLGQHCCMLCTLFPSLDPARTATTKEQVQ